jgi:DNA-binding GntR family transcriptional regulator
MTTKPRVAQPLPRASLAQRVAEELRAAIFDGRIGAGTTLRQSALAREFGVSVIPLREALCQLEGEGLVHHQAHRGVVVADMSAEDVAELILICGTLESLAFTRAVPHLSDTDVDEAERILAELRGTGDVTAFGDLAWRMRSALLRPSRSPRLLQMLEALNKGNRRYFALFLRDEAARKWLFVQWTRLVKLARKRDVAGVIGQLERSQREGSAIAKRLLPRPATESKP